MRAVGIDVGTTTIGLVSLELADGTIRERYSLPNPRVPSQDEYAYLQDPEAVGRAVDTLLGQLSAPPSCIGVTGQVHGILYTDPAGKPLSPLYTWLDRRGTEPVDGELPSERLFRRTGKTLPSGYGLLTHYAVRMRGEVPIGAAHMLGICEYATGELIRRPLLNTDPSCLAPFGFWDPVSRTHDRGPLEEILPPGSPAFLTASDPFEPAGTTPDGIPVCYPVGDNQAGFFGLVADTDASCLVNLGTSGQLSVFTAAPRRIASMELRPFPGEGYLQVGATLCAGKAYEVLERFFRSVMELSGGEADDAAVYTLMEKAARIPSPGPALSVTTAFNGTREDAGLRGSVSGIGLDNLTPGNLVLGTVDGIIGELAGFRVALGEEFGRIGRIVAAGNAVRRNPLFAEALSRKFALPVSVPDIDDGAAVGVALIAAVSSGLIDLPTRKSIVESFRHGS